MNLVEPKVSEFYQQGLSAWEVSAKLGLSRSFQVKGFSLMARSMFFSLMGSSSWCDLRRS